MIYLDEADLNYIPSTKGKDVRKFEKAMADYLGVDDCVAVNSGTSALYLSLLACDIGPGDVVVVPATTFVATANAVLYTGAKVRIVDIDRDSWSLPRGVVEDTTAIVPVSLYGGKVEYSIPFGHYPVVLDLAEALGIISPVGLSVVDYSCFSFNGNKTITTGGGGLMVGRDLDKIRKLIRPAYSNELAYNYGMPAINARLGLRQIEKLEINLAKKKRFNEIYRNELPPLVFQGDKAAAYWMTACILPQDKITGVNLQWKLYNRFKIPTRRIFKPLNHYPYLSDGKECPNAEYLYKYGICLPSSPRNTEKDIMYVCKKIKEVLK